MMANWDNVSHDRDNPERNLLQSHAALRGALISAGKAIAEMDKRHPILPILRRVLADARKEARAHGAKR